MMTAASTAAATANHSSSRIRQRCGRSVVRGDNDHSSPPVTSRQRQDDGGSKTPSLGRQRRRIRFFLSSPASSWVILLALVFLLTQCPISTSAAAAAADESTGTTATIHEKFDDDQNRRQHNLRGGGGGSGIVQEEEEEEEEQQQQRQLAPESRIVGGSPVSGGQYPYFVQWEGALCGGAVIHDDIVISAAHCFDPENPPASRRLWLGSIFRNQGTLARYIHTEVHPLYDSKTAKQGGGYAYDFVLLKTATSMIRNSFGPTGIQAIPINRDPMIPEDDRPALAVGFGQRTEHEAVLSPILMDVLFYYVNSQTCANQYVERGKFNKDVMFCTGVPGGGKDTCTGDSGGPVIDYRSRTLVGVVSWGEGCAREDYSGVNARVSAVAEWIDEMICKLSRFRPTYCPSKVPPVSNAEEGPEGEGDSDTTDNADAPGGAGGGGGSIVRPGGLGGSSGSIMFPGATEVGAGQEDNNDGGGNSNIPDGSSPTNANPMYKPDDENASLSSSSGVGGSSNTQIAFRYPGKSPLKATNTVTINILYQRNSQLVRWALEYENLASRGKGNGKEDDEYWEPIFLSPRGKDGYLATQTFQDLPAGWYRFHLEDVGANPNKEESDYSISWTSVMGPRGDQIWGKDTDFTKPKYDIYFEVSSQTGIPSLGSRPDYVPPAPAPP